MNTEQQMNYLDTVYKIIAIEQEYIIHPSALGYVPVTTEAIKHPFSCCFHMDDYQMILDKIMVYPDDKIAIPTEIHDFTELKMSYNGAVLIGNTLVKEFNWGGFETACFSYKNVYELVFENGILITSIDQSRAMQRIRKNIELGYRSIANKHDVHVIKHFLNSSLIGDYKLFFSNRRRLKYIKEMKKDYDHRE